MDQDAKKKYDSLPKDVKAAIDSADVFNKLQNIGKKHQLHIDQIETLGGLVSLVLIGDMHPDEFVTEIEDALEITVDEAVQITAEINMDIFMSIRTSLMQMYDKQSSSQSASQPVPAQKVDLGSKLSAQTMAYPPKAAQPLMSPRSTFNTNPPKPLVTNGNVAPKPITPIGVIPPKPPAPVQQIPIKPASQPTIQPKPQGFSSAPTIMPQSAQPQARPAPVINPNPNMQAQSGPKIVPLMKKDALLAEIEDSASGISSSSSGSSKGMIDEHMADKFIAGKLKKIADNQVQKTSLEIRPNNLPAQQPQSKDDPYRENL